MSVGNSWLLLKCINQGQFEWIMFMWLDLSRFDLPSVEQFSHLSASARLVLTNRGAGGGLRGLLMSSSGSCMRIEMVVGYLAVFWHKSEYWGHSQHTDGRRRSGLGCRDSLRSLFGCFFTIKLEYRIQADHSFHLPLCCKNLFTTAHGGNVQLRRQISVSLFFGMMEISLIQCCSLVPYILQV